MATVIDLYSRRLLGAAMGLHPDADLACAAMKMAVAARGGRQAIWREREPQRVIFHTDRGSTYTANVFTTLCRQLGIRQSEPSPVLCALPLLGRMARCRASTTRTPRPGRCGWSASTAMITTQSGRR